MYNIMLIGNDLNQYAKDIWEYNKGYTIINDIKSIYNKELQEYIKTKPSILVLEEKNASNLFYNYNRFIDYCIKFSIIPYFVSEPTDGADGIIWTDIVTMFYSISSIFLQSLLYIKNDKNEGYLEFIKEIGAVITNGDNTISTPTGGSTTPSGE